MEPVWNGMLTCDYERTRPQATRFEWDLYTQSLIRWPVVLMNDAEPYGRLRRAGIVDIPEAVGHALTGRWYARLRDLDYVAHLIPKQRPTGGPSPWPSTRAAPPDGKTTWPATATGRAAGGPASTTPAPRSVRDPAPRGSTLSDRLHLHPAGDQGRPIPTLHAATAFHRSQ
jgi:hypothetical protein